MPVMISGKLHLSNRDARGGASNTELRHLYAKQRLGETSVEELAMVPARVIYSEVRAFFRSRRFHCDYRNEKLPSPNRKSYDELLTELQLIISRDEASLDVDAAHRIVCQMLANGF